MRKIIIALLVFSLTLGPQRPAFAWNKAGHMVTGAIAYQTLKAKDPAALAKILEILEEHPDYDDWQDAFEHTAVEDGMVIFMLAARWPDDARGTPEDRPTHHYINLPYLPQGDSPDLNVPDDPEGELIIAFRHHLDILRDATKPAKQRAISIAWLLHLIGDCHQPLHTAKLFTPDFPDGDRGGTRFYVRVGSKGAGNSLHSLWDGAVIGYEGFNQVRNKAGNLQTSHPAASFSALGTSFADADFQKWVTDESFPLAKTKAYLDGALKGGKSKGKAKTLPKGYTTTMKSTTEERITLAGYRIASVLSAAVD